MTTYDQYGNVIEAGDYITYPVRKGSVLYVQTGRVLRVESRSRKVGRRNVEETVLRVAANSPLDFNVVRKVTISRPDRTVVIPKSYAQGFVVQRETTAEVTVNEPISEEFWS